VSIGAVSFFSALFVAFFFWFLSLFALSRTARWLLTLLYAFASVALPYSTVFYSHQLVAGALFTAFALLYLVSRRMCRPGSVPAAGFLLGFAFFTEYTVALAIIVIGLYGLWAVRGRVRRIASMTAAGAVPVAGLFAYNYACFGNPLDTGYSHDFCWSSAQGAGFAGFTYPHLGPLFDLTVGPFRGLFFASPFLLLAIPGLLVMRKRGLGPEALVCAITVVLFILAISAYWGWNGGKVDGPRYLVPIVPFCALRGEPDAWLGGRKGSRCRVGLLVHFCVLEWLPGGRVLPHLLGPQPPLSRFSAAVSRKPYCPQCGALSRTAGLADAPAAGGVGAPGAGGRTAQQSGKLAARPELGAARAACSPEVTNRL